MSKRNIQRINYEILNSTGEKVNTSVDNGLSAKLSNLSLNNTEMPSSDLKLDVLVVIEEIKDILDENPIHGSSESDLNTTTAKLESLRSTLRRKDLQLKASEPKMDGSLESSINEAMGGIKEYIKSSKDLQNKLRLKEEKSKIDEKIQHERSVSFLIEYTLQWITELENEFEKNVRDAEGEDLLRWRTELPIHSKKLEKVAVKYQEILMFPINNADAMIAVKNIGERYVKLDSLKHMYTSSLCDEISRREIDKDNLFKKDST